MKLNENNVEVLSNVKAQKTAFSISENAQDTALAIDVITNKGYKHKIQTPVQEYICNARDAHREAGQLRPIEITLPTAFDPIFKVRDFGLGIDPTKMGDVFVKFFASTKRRDNKQTGGFGLGAKSAWAYTDSFGIISITDGMKRTYTAYKAGQGMLQPEGEVATTEHSGVEISIAVNPRDISEFKKAVVRAVYFWKESERPVLVNDKNGIQYPKDPVRYGRFAFYGEEAKNTIADRYQREDMVILDGVPYSLDNDVLHKLNVFGESRYNRKIKNFFLVVETGEVSITPFRESLEFNENTLESLKTLLKDSKNALMTAYGKAQEDAKTSKEKIEVLKAFNPCLEMDQLKLNDIIHYSTYGMSISMETAQWASFSMYTLNGDKLQPVYRKGSYNSSVTLQTEASVVEFDAEKDPISERTARLKFIQFAKEKKSTSRGHSVVFVIFNKESAKIKKMMSEVFDIICTSTLTYTKEEKPKKAREVREQFEAMDLSDKKNMVRLEFDDEQLENTFYVYASEVQQNKYEMERFGLLLKAKKQTLLSISKGDEKHLVKKGAKKLQDNINMIQFAEKDLLGFIGHYEGHSQDYLIKMEEAFTNETVLAYIAQLKVIDKARKTRTDSDYYGHYNIYALDSIKEVIEKNQDYKNLLTIYKKGSKMIKDNFFLLESLSHIQVNKEVLKEITAYVKSKEKGV